MGLFERLQCIHVKMQHLQLKYTVLNYSSDQYSRKIEIINLEGSQLHGIDWQPHNDSGSAHQFRVRVIDLQAPVIIISLSTGSMWPFVFCYLSCLGPVQVLNPSSCV
ncbi:SH2 domain-containing protein 4A [Platysternon megacephalum]|uniref:SH2 domain-containing protein 4A n=1 Tax=Platysternon megacephalum TaxID=55544 RepID=A0A4D9E2S4_9SAUR|nr:SH2 domain-containing protein 4A [Platysternon megacephalum]